MNERLQSEAQALYRKLSKVLAVVEAHPYDEWGRIIPGQPDRAARLRRAWEHAADRWRRRCGYRQIYK